MKLMTLTMLVAPGLARAQEMYAKAERLAAQAASHAQFAKQPRRNAAWHTEVAADLAARAVTMREFAAAQRSAAVASASK